MFVCVCVCVCVRVCVCIEFYIYYFYIMMIMTLLLRNGSIALGGFFLIFKITTFIILTVTCPVGWAVRVNVALGHSANYCV